MSATPSRRVAGKIAMVTGGGGGGIGRAIVEACAALGARAATIGVDPVRPTDLRGRAGRGPHRRRRGFAPGRSRAAS